MKSWLDTIDDVFALDEQEPFIGQMADEDFEDYAGFKGGQGSGNYGHEGRPGLVGGSSSTISKFNSGKDRVAIRGLFNTFYAQTIDKEVSENERAALAMMASSIIRADTDHNDKLEIHVVRNGEEIVGVAATETLGDGIREIHSMGSTYPHGGAKMFKSILQDAAKDKVGLLWYPTTESDAFWARTGFPRSKGGIAYQLTAEQVATLSSGKRLVSMKSIEDWWPDNEPNILIDSTERDQVKGGEGSGNFGHAGRPGLVGGSAPDGGGASQPVDTQTRYKVGGHYKKERVQSIHKPIIEKAFADAIPSDDRIVYFLGGGPAAGKSSGGVGRLRESGALAGYVHIDPDQIRTQFPEYQELVKHGDPAAGSMTHEEASDVSKEILAMANAGYNTVYDTSGDNDIDKLEAKVAGMRRGGAKEIRAEYTFLSSVDEAVARAKKRAENPDSPSFGRMVPEPLLRKMHASVARVFPEALKRGIFDTANLYNNDNGPELVATYTRKGGLVIKDQNAWDRFISLGGK